MAEALEESFNGISLSLQHRTQIGKVASGPATLRNEDGWCTKGSEVHHDQNQLCKVIAFLEILPKKLKVNRFPSDTPWTPCKKQ